MISNIDYPTLLPCTLREPLRFSVLAVQKKGERSEREGERNADCGDDLECWNWKKSNVIHCISFAKLRDFASWRFTKW